MYREFKPPMQNPRKFSGYWTTDGKGNGVVFDHFTGELLWSILTLSARVKELETMLEIRQLPEVSDEKI